MHTNLDVAEGGVNDCLAETLKLVDPGPLGDRYIIEKIIRLQGAVAGLNRSSRPEDEKKADRAREILTALLAMREEWRHANCP